MLLKGKTAFIGGAGRNNGRAIAVAFAREGADLILVAREMGDQLKQAAEECERCGVNTLPLLMDLSDPRQAERAVAQALERFGHGSNPGSSCPGGAFGPPAN